MKMSDYWLLMTDDCIIEGEQPMTDQHAPGEIRARVLISGRVQGVSFRWYTQRTAQRLGLAGWVRNVWDGRVEALFEGPDQKVREAVTWCHHGDGMARVEDVEVTYEKASGEFEGFRITW
jgi:acylphosphatase